MQLSASFVYELDQIQEYEVTISLQIQNKTLNKIVQATAVHADTRLYSNDLT